MVHGSKPREMKLSIINKVVIHRYTTTSMLFTRQCSVPQQVELHAQSGAVEVICIGGKTGYDWGRVFSGLQEEVPQTRVIAHGPYLFVCCLVGVVWARTLVLASLSLRGY